MPLLGRASTRVPVLDGLRGGGLLLVLMVHFRSVVEPSQGAWGEYVYHMVGDWAFVALDVFFVLSGFLITRILVDTKGSPTYFRTFYLRRSVRIFPLYYGLLIAYFVVLPRIAWWDVDNLSLTFTQHFVYWTYLTNISAGLYHWWFPMAPPGLYPMEVSTGHLWTLAVEEQFYLLWPAVVFYCSPEVLRKVCIGCLGAAALIRIGLVVGLGPDVGAAYVLTPARIDGLALGGLLALYARYPGGLERARRVLQPAAALSFGVLLGVFLLEGHFDDQSALGQTAGLTASVYLAGAVVVVSLLGHQDSVWTRIVGSLPLRRIGQYSYGTYVLHLPLMFTLHSAGVITRPLPNSGLSTDLRYSAGMIMISLTAGALSWHCFEKPIMRMLSRRPYDFRAPAGMGGEPAGNIERPG